MRSIMEPLNEKLFLDKYNKGSEKDRLPKKEDSLMGSSTHIF